MNPTRTERAIKQKTCKVCRNKFTPTRQLQAVCDYKCAQAKAEKDGAKKAAKEATRQRVEHRRAKEKAKTRAEWLKDVQVVFNAYIRARDGKVCISCGTTKPTIQYAAGHYRTRGAAGHLRFNEDNCHSQCNSYCNLHLSGNIVNYRPRLIAKIGLERVDALENDNSTHTWTIEELKELKALYKLKLKQLGG